MSEEQKVLVCGDAAAPVEGSGETPEVATTPVEAPVDVAKVAGTLPPVAPRRRLPRPQELYIEVNRLRIESAAKAEAIRTDAKKRRMDMVNDTTTRVALLHRERDEKIAALRSARDKAKRENEQQTEETLRRIKKENTQRLHALDAMFEEERGALRDACSAACAPIEEEYRTAEATIRTETEAALATLTEATEDAVAPLVAEISAMEARVKAARERLAKKAGAGGEAR
jgi:hypothetical protein